MSKIKGTQIEPATTAASGGMSAADKAKLDGITPGAAVSDVTGTAPVTSTGGTTPAIGITAATGVAAGSMSAADKAKLDGMTPGAAIASVSGTAPITSSGGTTPAIGITAATGVAAGSMSAADKAKLDGISAGADVTAAALVAAGTTTADVADTANKKKLVPYLLTSLSTGTSQFLSFTDAVFSGLVAGGRASGVTGTIGVVAGSFASSGAETGTGANQGGLSSAANSDQPYNATDFPGGRFPAGLFHIIGSAHAGEPILLSDVLSTAGLTYPMSVGAPVFLYLSYRSDLGANLKWRGCFYFTNVVTGLDTPFVPDTSVSAQVTVPVVYQEKNVPTAGPYVPIPGRRQGIVYGLAGDIADVGAAAAAGATGKLADAGHVHDHGNQTDPAMHALATSDLAGFMPATDKAFFDLGPLVEDVESDDFTFGGNPADGAAAITPNGTVFGKWNWRSSFTGTSSAITKVTTTQDKNTRGVLELKSGSSAGAFACIFRAAVSTPSFTLGDNQYLIFQARIQIPVIADGTDDFSFRCGYFVASTGAIVDGIYFEYVRATSVNWRGVSMKASAATVASGGTNVAVSAGAYVVLTMIYDASTNKLQFYVGATLIGEITITGVIPTVAMTEGFQQLRIAGAARTTLIDLVRQKIIFSPSR